MGKADVIDTEALLRKAKAAEFHESFEVVKRGKGFRIGVGARNSNQDRRVFFIEAIVDLAPPSPTVDLHLLECKLGILKRLMAMGYTLTYQDDLSILGEAEFPGNEIESECRSLNTVLAEMP